MFHQYLRQLNLLINVFAHLLKIFFIYLVHLFYLVLNIPIITKLFIFYQLKLLLNNFLLFVNLIIQHFMHTFNILVNQTLIALNLLLNIIPSLLNIQFTLFVVTIHLAF